MKHDKLLSPRDAAQVLGISYPTLKQWIYKGQIKTVPSAPGGPLGEGYLEGSVVTCPWHGWQFNVIDGKDVQDPTAGVACYPTELRGDEIYVDTGAKA